MLLKAMYVADEIKSKEMKNCSGYWLVGCQLEGVLREKRSRGQKKNTGCKYIGNILVLSWAVEISFHFIIFLIYICVICSFTFMKITYTFTEKFSENKFFEEFCFIFKQVLKYIYSNIQKQHIQNFSLFIILFRCKQLQVYKLNSLYFLPSWHFGFALIWFCPMSLPYVQLNFT